MISNKHKIFLGLIFFGSVVLGLSFLSSSMIAEDTDAYGRLNMVNFENEFNRDEFFNFDPRRYGPWLPLHFKLLRLSLAVHDDVFFSPRLLTLVLSSVSVVLLYYYSLLVTKSSSVSLLSAILFLFLPQRIFLSTVTLAEPIFVFFLLWGLILIFKTPPNYWAGLTLLNIAGGIRYESWFLLLLIWVMFWKENKSKLKRYLLILASSFFPIIWLILNYSYYRSPVGFIASKIENARVDNSAYWNFPLAFSEWVEKLTEVLSHAGVGLIILGWYRLVKTNNNFKAHALGFLPLAAFMTLPAQVFLGTMEWYPDRYLSLTLVLAMPLLALGIARVKVLIDSASLMKQFPIYKLTILLFGFIFGLQTYINYAKISVHYRQYYFENQDVVTVVQIIKRKSIIFRPAKIVYFHNDKPEERLPFHAIIKYLTNNHPIGYLEKSKLRNSIADSDFFIVEADNKANVNAIPRQYSFSGYRLAYQGEKLALYAKE